VAWIGPLTASSFRRSTRSAQAPDGTSSRNDAADQMISSDEIAPADRPWSANSSE
jgi:hypothetical protein